MFFLFCYIYWKLASLVIYPSVINFPYSYIFIVPTSSGYKNYVLDVIKTQWFILQSTL